MILSFKRLLSKSLLLGTIVATLVGLSTSMVSAVATSTTSSTEQTHLQNIITRGDQEITRRLTSLQAALTKINDTTKLSASDKSYLVTEINTEISGLTSLKTKLDSETSLSGAMTDAISIFTDYRVYALVLPKAYLVAFADAEQSTEVNLTTLAQKLQQRINSAKAAGTDVTALQTILSDMITQTNNGLAISHDIEVKVLPLQPSDYNSDHSILSGDVSQLKLAHTDNQQAWQDAKNIVAGIEKSR